MDSENLYIVLGRLIENMPDLANITLNAENLKWLGDAYALAEASGDIMSSIELKSAIDTLSKFSGYRSERAAFEVKVSARKIQTILYRVLSTTELKAPASIQGSFIPAGNAFDAMAMISKVLNKACTDILIVDPYLDEKILTDFVIVVPENVTIRLLADQNDLKSSLKPAFQRWVTQYGDKRPLELRLASPRAVHDRLIITDNSEAWISTQSFNALAVRSPASIVRFPDPSVKIAAYNDMWLSSNKIEP